jgi:hypothetical protein
MSGIIEGGEFVWAVVVSIPAVATRKLEVRHENSAESFLLDEIGEAREHPVLQMEVAGVHDEDIWEEVPPEYFELRRTPSGGRSFQNLLKVGCNGIVDCRPCCERGPGFRVHFGGGKKCQENDRHEKADKGGINAHQAEFAALPSIHSVSADKCPTLTGIAVRVGWVAADTFQFTLLSVKWLGEECSAPAYCDAAWSILKPAVPLSFSLAFE